MPEVLSTARPSSSGRRLDDEGEDREALSGLYLLHFEIGYGGFGRVKLGTHLLTGVKVAVKIVDKIAVGENLPRVRKEIEALRVLSHQNICRLYQTIETEHKFYIIMEYCEGGELFDYIVKKSRLPEDEARFFFRQLLKAVMYVHKMGFAHRDLKPENLLLTGDLQLKLIDFGLCARIGGVDSSGNFRETLVKTACGSPTYAAPELIQSVPYVGSAADVWSMGVLLYGLLCGRLPFDDVDLNGLYRKIQKGKYVEPRFLSQESKDLIRRMLEKNPADRLPIMDLVRHPWVAERSTVLKWQTIYDKNVLNDAVIVEIAAYFELPLLDMEEIVKQWRFDYVTATYLLLDSQKKFGYAIALPPRSGYGGLPESGPGKCLASSPTVHASLELGLEKAGVVAKPPVLLANGSKETAEVKNEGDHQETSGSSSGKTGSYVLTVLGPSPVFTGWSPQQDRACGFTPSQQDSAFATPLRSRKGLQKKGRLGGASNDRPGESDRETSRPATARERPTSTYDAVRDDGLSSCDSPISPQVAVRSKSLGRGATASSTPEPKHTPRLMTKSTPRSASKSPVRRLQKHLFASLERVEKQAGRMRNLFTPKKVSSDCPEILSHVKTMANVTLTTSRDPDMVLVELFRVFKEQHLNTCAHGWKLSGKTPDGEMTVELQVVLIELAAGEHRVGIKRRRLCGNSFRYKNLCEEILRLASL